MAEDVPPLDEPTAREQRRGGRKPDGPVGVDVSVSDITDSPDGRHV